MGSSGIVFKGLGNLANVGAMIRKAQEMGGRVEQIQQELRTKRATGQAGGGLVEVEVNGLSEVLTVRIEPSLVEKMEREMIEDLLPAAFNAAQRKAKEMHDEMLYTLMGDMPFLGDQQPLSQISPGPEDSGKP